MLIAGANPGARAIATAVAASSLLYGFAYLGVSVAPDLRYNLWTMVGAMLAVPLGFANWSTGDRSARRLVWAFLPLALILLGELAALALG